MAEKRLEDMTEVELLEELARRKAIKKQVEEAGNGSDIEGTRIRTAGAESAGEPSGAVSPQQSSAGIQGIEGQEGARRIQQSESELSARSGRDADKVRGVSGSSMEQRNPPSDSGTGERLEPPITSSIPATSPAHDLILERNTDIGATATAMVRFDANLAAIRTLRKIESENRNATPQEQAVLAKYSGFGDSSFEDAFDEWELKNVSRSDKQALVRRGIELKELLTEEEWGAVKKSRINAFFTPPEIIAAMWDGLAKLGANKLSHPRVLEPSAGTGRFFGLEPKELASRSVRTAVELDEVTGKILHQLYPDTEVHIMGYEAAPLPKESMDIAVSNVPFGNIPVFDPTMRRERHKFTRSVHNYFFVKTLENLRPGGVMAFITSHYTMDSNEAKPVREALAAEADLLGAVRLPQGAFPDTQVVTDIIYLRKRLPTDKPGDKSWVDTESQHIIGHDRNGYGVSNDVDINKYFLVHPEMVLGKHSLTGSMYGRDSYSVEPDTTRPVSTALPQALDRLPADVFVDSPYEAAQYAGGSLPASGGARENSRVADKKGHVFITKNGRLINANLISADEKKIGSMLEIRDAARRVVNLQLDDESSEDIAKAQAELDKIYRKYVLEHGVLSNPENVDLLKDDPDQPFLSALENKQSLQVERDKRTDKDRRIIRIYGGKEKLNAGDLKDIQMPIFQERVLKGMKRKASVTTEEDAESVARNETGRLDFVRMAELLGSSQGDVINNLLAKRIIYKNPVGDYEPADQYLSGDVREKLKVAEKAAKASKDYKVNLEALRAVQPPDISAGQIGVSFGAPWIPSNDVNDFIRYILDMPSWGSHRGDEYFRYNLALGEWQAENKMNAREALLNNEWGTMRMPANALIDRILNSKPVEVFDRITGPDGKEQSVRNPQETILAREKAKAVEDKFKEWIWSDPERTKRLVETYNDKFNNYRPRAFDGGHQVFPGIELGWAKKLHGHQKDAIWRVVQDRNVLLAHEVGFGKTAVIVAGAMELRRLGISRKNLIVVPKSTYAQFTQQFKDLYPFAKILTPESDDFGTAKRAEFVSRAQTGDWDAIILADSQFVKIPVKPQTEIKLMEEEMAAFEEALELENEAGHEGRRGGSSRTTKDLEKSILKLSVKIQEKQLKLKEKADTTTYFEDLGIDQLFVDEADYYKNLSFATRMGRIKGLPNSESQRAWDMYSKIRHIQRAKGRGVCFATGTPIANTIAEMYTSMRYLQPDVLEAKGLKHFDAWAKTFGETTETLEQTPTGQYRLTQRFAKFQNAPELSGMWQQVADIRVADEVPELVALRPRLVDADGKAKRTVLKSPADDALKSYMKVLADRADNLKNMDPHDDNMLKIANDARLASLDMRMVVPNAPVNPEGKVSAVSRNVAKIYKEENARKGTQLIFLDIGTPKAKDKETEPSNKPEGLIEGAEIPNELGVTTAEDDVQTVEEAKVLRDVYINIKNQLIADGVPANEIAFIHQAKNAQQKILMQERVNSGEIRVIIGSTGKMGTGLNIQKRAAALHHIDSPWRPRDIEQREGRIVRQGNEVYGPELDENNKRINPNPDGTYGRGVKIFTYVMSHSFDAYMWQAIEAKSKAIKSIMKRHTPPRVIEDIDSLSMSAGEAKALATGNPDVLKQVTLKNNINRLQLLRGSWLDSKLRAKEKMANLPALIEDNQKASEVFAKDLSKTEEPKSFRIVLDGETFTDRPSSYKKIEGIINTAKFKDPKVAPVVGQYRGFDVKAIDEGPQTGYRLILVSPDTGLEYPTNEMRYGEVSGDGAERRLDNSISLIKNKRNIANANAEAYIKNLEAYKVQYEKPFEYDDRLNKLFIELATIDKKLQTIGVGGPSDTYETDTAEIEDLENMNEEELKGEEAEPEYHYSALAEEQKTEPVKPNLIQEAADKLKRTWESPEYKATQAAFLARRKTRVAEQNQRMFQGKAYNIHPSEGFKSIEEGLKALSHLKGTHAIRFSKAGDKMIAWTRPKDESVDGKSVVETAKNILHKRAEAYQGAKNPGKGSGDKGAKNPSKAKPERGGKGMKPPKPPKVKGVGTTKPHFAKQGHGVTRRSDR